MVKMLLKTRISQIDINDFETWKHARNARFTSSRANELFGRSNGIDYIRTRVFESISGVSSEQEFMTEASVHGNVHEGIALRKIKAKFAFEFMVMQKLIYGENEHFCSTPDGLWVKKV